MNYQLLTDNLCSKERIELRGAIAKDVNLDVQIFKPKVKQNLLESIISGRKRK